MRTSVSAVLAALCVLGSGVAFADTVEVQAEIVAAPELNPNATGRPSPVNLILFQLTAADAFENADFFSLHDEAEPAILGDDLIARQRMLMQPGETNALTLELDEEARFVGIIAAFYDIENAQWRGLVELPQKGFFRRVFSRDRLFIELDALSVAVKVE